MKSNRFAKNDEGVSAVIGVILMVAITVILAAVIAAFVFGMVGNVNNKKNPAFTVKRISNDEVQLTLQDLGGATTISNFIMTAPTNGAAYTYKIDGTAVAYAATGETPASGKYAVGDTVDISEATGTTTLQGTIHFVATALVDGSTQVVIDTNV